MIIKNNNNNNATQKYIGNFFLILLLICSYFLIREDMVDAQSDNTDITPTISSTNGENPTLDPSEQKDIFIQTHGGANDIAVTWQVTDALAGQLEAYQIFRYIQTDDSQPLLLARQINATYIDNNNLEENKEYCYYIEAVNKDDQVIGLSGHTCASFGELQLVVQDHLIQFGSTNNSIPITVINGNGSCLSAIDIKFNYDPTVVNITGIEKTEYAKNAVYRYNITDENEVKISAILGSNCLPLAGTGALFHIIFDVIGDEGADSPLDFISGLESTVIYDDDNLFTPLPLTFMDGSITIIPKYLKGDLNDDGAVNAADAQMALVASAGGLTLTYKQQLSCDINGDIACNSADAYLILCRASDGAWGTCGSNALLRSSSFYQGIQETQLIIETFDGDDITLINIEDGIGITGGSLTLTYDPNEVTIEEILMENSLLHDAIVAIEQKEGLIRIAFANQNPIQTNGALFTLRTTGSRDSIQIAGSEFNDNSGLDWLRNLNNSIIVLRKISQGVTATPIMPTATPITPTVTASPTDPTITPTPTKHNFNTFLPIVLK